MKRKGEIEIQTIMLFLLTLIVLLVFSYFLWYAQQGSNLTANKQILQNWVFSPLFLVERQTPGGDIFFETGRPPIPHLYDEPIKLTSQDQLKGKGQQTPKIHEDLANAMLDCYEALGSGQDFLYQVERKTYCYACAILAVDDSLKKQDIALLNFNTYLAETQVPNKNGQTYLEVLSGGRTWKKEITNDQIPLKSDLFVYMVATKGLPLNEILEEAFLTSSTFFAAGASVVWIPGIGQVSALMSGIVGTGIGLSTALIDLDLKGNNFESTVLLADPESINKICQDN